MTGGIAMCFAKLWCLVKGHHVVIEIDGAPTTTRAAICCRCGRALGCTFVVTTAPRVDEFTHVQILETDVLKTYERERHLYVNPCGDCGALSGALHAVGCNQEDCPKCGGRVISCDCTYADDMD